MISGVVPRAGRAVCRVRQLLSLTQRSAGKVLRRVFLCVGLPAVPEVRIQPYIHVAELG